MLAADLCDAIDLLEPLEAPEYALIGLLFLELLLIWNSGCMAPTAWVSSILKFSGIFPEYTEEAF
jgi:hypothetical protein